MRAREYDKRVKFLVMNHVDDGFSGEEPDTPTDLGLVWAKIKTIRPEKLQDLGLASTRNALRVHVRKNPEIDYQQDGLYMEYQNKTYNINAVEEVDHDQVDIRLIAIRFE